MLVIDTKDTFHTETLLFSSTTLQALPHYILLDFRIYLFLTGSKMSRVQFNSLKMIYDFS